MKKLLLTLALTLVSIGAFGQGQIIFNNNTATKITNSVTGQAAAALLTKVGLYTADNFGAAEGSLTLTTQTNTFAAGLFSTGVRVINHAGGQVTIQVRAWFAAVNNYVSYEDALSHVGDDASILLGKSVLMNFTLTESPTPANTLVAAGLNQFNIAPAVPEPSSIALGLLGLGAVALFRRRK